MCATCSIGADRGQLGSLRFPPKALGKLVFEEVVAAKNHHQQQKPMETTELDFDSLDAEICGSIPPLCVPYR